MKNEFDLWYYGEGNDKGYIRKEARGDARKAFAAARKVASLAELIEGRKAYADEKEGTERRFIQLPASWLRAEGWANEYIADDPVRHMGYDERREHGQKLLENVVRMK